MSGKKLLLDGEIYVSIKGKCRKIGSIAITGSVKKFVSLVKKWLLLGKNQDMKILIEKEYFYPRHKPSSHFRRENQFW